MCPGSQCKIFLTCALYTTIFESHCSGEPLILQVFIITNNLGIYGKLRGEKTRAQTFIIWEESCMCCKRYQWSATESRWSWIDSNSDRGRGGGKQRFGKVFEGSGIWTETWRMAGSPFFFFNSPHNALGIVHACVRADRARIRTLAYLTIKMFRIIKILRISLLHSGPIYFASFKNDCIF